MLSWGFATASSNISPISIANILLDSPSGEVSMPGETTQISQENSDFKTNLSSE